MAVLRVARAGRESYTLKKGMDGHRQQARELRRQIEWTLARATDPGDLLPMLHRLARLADDGSEESAFAHLHLAELLVERDPWRAALSARRVLAHRQDDDRGWATLALCQTLLGNYKFAVAAYHRALASAPHNPWYAHNLGHLLDVALGRAGDAIGWLRRAYDSAPQSGEVAASYAHALARVGRIPEARKVLAKAMRRGSSREHAALLKWLDQGAPPDMDHPLPRPAPVHTIAIRARERHANAAQREPAPRPGEGRRPDSVSSTRRAMRFPTVSELEAVLGRGMTSLPLDSKQRARAKTLAREAAAYFAQPTASRGGGSSRNPVDSIAAAVAYAIVYVDHVPLTQSEVAACFRVGVASLRGRFGELRAHLDLMPGDARYATLRHR
ncbi:MAG: tetratricopeptide repeat protein [Polyangiaceae bacterium]